MLNVLYYDIYRKIFLSSHFAFTVLFQCIFVYLLRNVYVNFFVDVPFPFLSVMLVLPHLCWNLNV